MMRRHLRENLSGIVFGAGLFLGCAGFWGWFSWPVAAVFAGVTLMGAALYPYVIMRPRR